MLSNLGFRSSQLPLFCWCLVGGEPDKAEATLSKCRPFVNQKFFLFSKKRKKSDVMFWGPFVCVD